jgi:hypothetical protein
MSSVPKLGNNRYLATSKGVNRMLNQLNGILAADNITVAPTVSMGTSSSITIDLSLGNFINVNLNTNNITNNITVTNIKPGIYYFLLKNGVTSSELSSLSNSKPTGTISPTVSATSSTLYTFISDGTTLYRVSYTGSIT